MKKYRILIVEDDPDSAFVLKKILLLSGYDAVCSEKTGKSVIDYVNNSHPDLVLMDVNFKGCMDGVSMAQLIRSQADVPILYLTAHSDDETVNRAKQTTPFAYILKPFREKDVLITIEMALFKADADRQIRAAQFRMSATLDSIQDSVLVVDQQGLLTYLNRAATQLAHLTLPNWKGKPIEQLLNLKEARTGGGWTLCLDKKNNDFIHPYHVTLSLDNGAEKVFKVSVTTLHSQKSEIEGYVVVLSDVTDQYKAEAVNRHLAAAIESLEDAVLITNADFCVSSPKIVYANAAFEKMTGCSLSETIGTRLSRAK